MYQFYELVRIAIRRINIQKYVRIFLIGKLFWKPTAKSQHWWVFMCA
jgi:hypothetical protein